jgi:hypothetical protein
MAEHLQARWDRLDKAGKDMSDALERAKAGKMSSRDMDRSKNDFERLLAGEEKAITPQRSMAFADRDRTFLTGVHPGPDFAAAAVPTIAGTPFPAPDDDIKPQGPTASTPAPM